MYLVDTHCHIYLEEFDVDREEMMRRTESAMVNRHFMPAINSSTHDKMMALEESYPGKCVSMIGLHPCYVKEDYQKELRIVEDWLQKRRFSAIGECGLDLYWDKTFFNQQKEALVQQISWAKSYDLSIVLHTRNATRETIDLIQKHHFEGMRGIFHCFGGSIDEANEITELGFHLGIGGVVTYKNAGLDVVVKELPLQHIVLETDAPYLAPTPNRGKRNEPSMLMLVAEKIAFLKNCTIEEVAQTTTENASKVFRI